MANYFPKKETESTPLVIPRGSKGVPVAIGASVVRAAKPPARPAVMISEATAKEYEWLYKHGYSEYIEKVEEPKPVKAKDAKKESEKEEGKTE